MGTQYIQLQGNDHFVNDQSTIKLSIMSIAAPRTLPTPQYVPQPEQNLAPVQNRGIEPNTTVAEPTESSGLQIKPAVSQQASEKIVTKPDAEKPKKETIVINKTNNSTLKPRQAPAKIKETEVIKLIQQLQQAVVPEQKKDIDAKEVKLATAKPVSTIDHNKGKQDSNSIIHEARFRKQTPPRYPRRAIELGQQGIVTLHAKIMPNGEPDKLKIAESSGHRLLDKAALSAVKKWEFEPTLRNGNAITSWVSVPVRFVIQ